jgi:hypothetical protein
LIDSRSLNNNANQAHPRQDMHSEMSIAAKETISEKPARLASPVHFYCCYWIHTMLGCSILSLGPSPPHQSTNLTAAGAEPFSNLKTTAAPRDLGPACTVTISRLLLSWWGLICTTACTSMGYSCLAKRGSSCCRSSCCRRLPLWLWHGPAKRSSRRSKEVVHTWPANSACQSVVRSSTCNDAMYSVQTCRPLHPGMQL